MLYQAMRRCWRFGQTKPVNVHIVISEAEGAVKANIERKEKAAEEMIQQMVKHTKKILAEELHGIMHYYSDYKPKYDMHIPQWLKSEVA